MTGTRMTFLKKWGETATECTFGKIILEKTSFLPMEPVPTVSLWDTLLGVYILLFMHGLTFFPTALAKRSHTG